MPNDAKLGMVFGVGLVVVFAVVLFRKDTSSSSADVPRAVTPAPRMSGVRGSATPRQANRIVRSPIPARRPPPALPVGGPSDRSQHNRPSQGRRVLP